MGTAVRPVAVTSMTLPIWQPAPSPVNSAVASRKPQNSQRPQLGWAQWQAPRVRETMARPILHSQTSRPSRVGPETYPPALPKPVQISRRKKLHDQHYRRSIGSLPRHIHTLRACGDGSVPAVPGPGRRSPAGDHLGPLLQARRAVIGLWGPLLLIAFVFGTSAMVMLLASLLGGRGQARSDRD